MFSICNIDYVIYTENLQSIDDKSKEKLIVDINVIYNLIINDANSFSTIINKLEKTLETLPILELHYPRLFDQSILENLYDFLLINFYSDTDYNILINAIKKEIIRLIINLY